MHNGMTADNRVHFRIQTDVKEDFKIAARLKGLKPSTYIHSLIVEAIGAAKKSNPEAFKRRGVKSGSVSAREDSKAARK
jgi:hypothetical protein